MKYSINIKTNYSLLSSIIKVKDLIKFAKDNNISYLGITDDNMFNTLEFYNECMHENIKPVVGVLIKTIETSFYLYPRNKKGYESICNILTLTNMDNKSIKDIIINDNLIVVCNIENYELFNNKYVFLEYVNEDEKNKCLLVTKNIIPFNKVLSLNKEDTLYLKYLYMIKDEEYKDFDFSSYYFKDISEDDKSYLDKFVSLINFEIPKYEISMPKYCDNSYEMLCNLCKKGLLKRLNGKTDKEYEERLNYEIKTIKEMGYVDYFLIVYDYVLFAKKNNIYVGPGRGSAVSSLVSYCLGITDIDPIKYGLMFERFLNKERSSFPDIDIDFEDKRRNEVIEYVKSKYDKTQSASIIAFDTLSIKQAIRDIGRILNVPLFKINKLTSTIAIDSSYKELINNKNFMGIIKYDEELSKVVKIASVIYGAKRHTTIHAAGLVISSDSLSNRVPLYYNNGLVLTSYSKEYIEQLGLLKMDFLGIKNLTIISNILKDIEKIYGKKINLNSVRLDDENTYNLFRSGNTLGVFQFESLGMRSFIKNFKINNFNDIVNALSLYRPGPRDMISIAIDRKNNNKKYELYSPCLEDTYGIIIYQEQIMKILSDAGSYSLNESDIIRRKLGKNNVEAINKEKERFIQSALLNGYTIEKAKTIFDEIKKSCGFSFNKSHAVAYTLISYQMAYLKINFKEIFIMNLLNEYISSPSKTKEYIEEAKTLKVIFKLPDINYSTDKYIKEDNSVILPLSVIRNIGMGSSNIILKERENGLFTDIYNVFERLVSAGINKGIFRSLIESGCLDNFGYNKKTLIENIEVLYNYAILCKDIDASLALKPDIEIFEEYDNSILFGFQEDIYGFFITSHPTTYFDRSDTINLKDIEKYFNKYVNIVAYVQNIKVINTKNGDKMAFINVSDENASIECIMFSKEYEKYYDVEKGNVIKINGKVEKRYDSYQIIISNIKKMY